MKSIQIVSLSICFLALFSAPVCSQQEVANDAYKNWSQFKVGTTATLKTTSKMGGKTVSQVNMVQKLVEKTDEQVVVEISTVVLVNGMEIKTPGNKITHKKNVKNSIDQKPANLPKNFKYEQTGKGKEKVKVGDTSYDCKWVATKTEFSSIKTDSKVWMSEKVPGMVVKMVAKTSSGIETTSELVEFSKK